MNAATTCFLFSRRNTVILSNKVLQSYVSFIRSLTLQLHPNPFIRSLTLQLHPNPNSLSAVSQCSAKTNTSVKVYLLTEGSLFKNRTSSSVWCWDQLLNWEILRPTSAFRQRRGKPTPVSSAVAAAEG